MTTNDLHDLAKITEFIKERGFNLRGWTIDGMTDAMVQREEIITMKFQRNFYVPLENDGVSSENSGIPLSDTAS